MAFKVLDNMLPNDVTTDIAKILHTSYMTDLVKEIPMRRAKMCPLSTAFEKNMDDPLQYLKDRYGVEVFTHGHNYPAHVYDSAPYDRPSYTWSALIIRIPMTNQIIGHYWHNESGYPSKLLFTGYFSDTCGTGLLVAEKFYYKDGVQPAAATTKEELDNGYDGMLSTKRIFNFLADISGWEIVDFVLSDDINHWVSDPTSIMTALDNYHTNMTTDDADEDIYD
jgi:hypothetical protein